MLNLVQENHSSLEDSLKNNDQIKIKMSELDPNGDFRKINEINEETWNSNQVLIQKYDIKTGWGESRARPKINLQKNGKL